MIYRIFRALARLSLKLFFRRIEIEARYNLPHRGPVLLVPNHSNSLVDPLLLLTSMRRHLTLTAKDALRGNPVMRLLICTLGVVTFHRKQDVGEGADRRKNIESLERCRHILSDEGAICIFPEGVSHSDPKLRKFQVGPAKLAIEFIRKGGNPGRLRVVPVGILYTDKDKFRSSAWLRFGEPIDVAAWMRAHPDAGAGELTQEICQQVSALTLNYESRKDSALVQWAGEIMATEGRDPPPLGAAERPVADWFRLLGRLQAGYTALRRTQPEGVADLSATIRRYRGELRRAGITAAEVHLRMHAGRAAFFVIRELELLIVGAPLALFGFVNHWLPCSIVRSIARRLSKDKDHWATNVIYPSLLVFPLFYLLQLAAAWRWLPALWAAAYTVALPYTGYYAILYGDRGRSAFRRTKTFLRFVFHRDEQQRLIAEGRSIVTRIRELADDLPAEPIEPQDPREAAVGPTFVISASNLERRFRDDLTILREVFDGLDRLEAAWTDARTAIRASMRGYFTPDEDDRIRGLLVPYRNYRLVLYEIIERYLDHDELRDPVNRLRAFMLGFASALTLYAKTVKLVLAYDRDVQVRAKLNEADERFSLPSGFFDELSRAYTSPVNYWWLVGCHAEWLTQRRRLRTSGLERDADWSWLAGVIARQRAAIRKSFWPLLWRRLRSDRGRLRHWLRWPIHRVRYGLRAFVGGTFAPLHTTPFYGPSLTSEILKLLRPQLRSGDVLLVRAEHKLTTALLPGFWSHAALYIGDRDELRAMGLDDDPRVRDQVKRMTTADSTLGYVIEAVSSGVVVQSLGLCLHADHVAVLRPNVSDLDRRTAIQEAFSHVGKAYDFEFDFNVTTRLVCSELIYRIYHGRGAVRFELTKRLGRYTLTCDDMARQFLAQSDADAGVKPPFALVSVVLRRENGQAQFVPPPQMMDVMRELAAGERPSRQPAELESTPATYAE